MVVVLSTRNPSPYVSLSQAPPPWGLEVLQWCRVKGFRFWEMQSTVPQAMGHRKASRGGGWHLFCPRLL